MTPTTDVLLVGPELAGTLMTPDEFDAIEDFEEGYRYELIQGVLVVTPIPSEGEADPNEELGHWLRTYQQSKPDGRSLDLTLSERYVRTRTSRRKPDRVVWAGLGRRPNPRQDHPTIVIEFVSKSRRDRLRDFVAKREEYHEIGIPEYWIIDRFRRQMTVVRSCGGTTTEVVVPEGEAYRTPLLPGFELPLARLLAVADRWADA